jgi:hypothetical protein
MDGPEREEASPQEASRRRYRRWKEEDGKRWKQSFENGKSILEIAAADQVDPKLVSQWLHRLGVEVYQGRHRVEQLPLKIPTELVELLSKGPDYVLKFLDERVWELTATESGTNQLTKFCNFLELHKQGIGVLEIAKQTSSHRSTILEWRQGTDQPYLVRAASTALKNQFTTSEKILPMHLDSGGNEQSDWIRVPTHISQYSDIEQTVNRLTPLPQTYELGKKLGLSESQTRSIRHELFAYLLGMMVGDLGKSGNKQRRFASTNLDLQLSQKHPSNERFGTFVCLATNCLGIPMDRIGDKAPTGDTKRSRNPTSAYRWTSERSPLFAWMFSVCLGLRWTQLTSYDPVNMDWIFEAPFDFRKRFVQAIADSDGRVKSYVVEIVSVPNADFVTRLLHTLDLPSAYTRIEYGQPLRTSVRAKEAAELPIFNEFIKSYRYEYLMRYKQQP